VRRRPAAFILHRRSPVHALIDFVLAAGAYYLGFKMRVDGERVVDRYSDLFNETWYLAAACVVLVVWAFGGYHRRWRLTDTGDVVRVVQGVIFGMLLLFGVNELLRPVPEFAGSGHGVLRVPLGALAFAVVSGVLLLVGVRLLTRSIYERRLLLRFRSRDGGRTVLIVGAGDGGRMVAREMLRNPELRMRPVGFVDDDPQKQRARIDGVRVLGPIADLPRLLEEVAPDEVVIAIPSAPGTLRATVLRAGRRAGVPVRTMPTVFELLRAGDGTAVRQVRDVRVEDVLGREPVRMELHRVGAYLRDLVVLVTGAGGSIGSELCRQIARVGPARLVLLDHAEDNLFRIERELLDVRQTPESVVRSVIADVKDGDRIRDVLAEHRPDVVFHAAAYKHVGLMEQNPVEAVGNNAIATRSLVRLCGEQGVGRFVLVSTDKAVAPATVMGASKALAELAVESGSQRWPDTRWSCVRFGNVLGSSGSVVPIFQEQIRLGGPVTVTDPAMTRYFMTIPEAVQLVIQAGSFGTGGEILVLDMGDPVGIMDLARDMIELSGLRPDEDIAIEIVGPRPGEKLHEELVNPFEVPGPTEADRIQRAERPRLAPDVVEEMFDQINLLVLDGDPHGLAAKVGELQAAYETGERDGHPSAYTGPL